MVKPTPMFVKRRRQEEMEEAIRQEIQKKLEHRRDQFISKENSLRYKHGQTWFSKDVDANLIEGEFQVRSTENTVKFSDIIGNNGDVILQQIKETSEAMHAVFLRDLFAILHKTTEETGNVVSLPMKTTKERELASGKWLSG